jgi:hypothetical protein
MPGVLSEGMFLSNERELRYLKRPGVRARMAVAYYDAIAKYLERRTTHAGYELVAAPDAAAVSGETVAYALEVRNGGNETMRDWRLRASAYPAPSRYIGRIRPDTSSGEARIPRLEPGESAIVEIEVTAPEPGGDWMLLFDARDRDGNRAAGMGSPMLQVPLTTVDPAPPSPGPDSVEEG